MASWTGGSRKSSYGASSWGRSGSSVGDKRSSSSSSRSSGGGSSGGSSGGSTTSSSYTAAIAASGITRSEWSSMNAAARAAVQKAESAGTLRASGTPGPAPNKTTAQSLTIVNKSGEPVTKYTAVTERFTVKNQAEARVRGVVSPGSYQTRTLYAEDVRKNYTDFGTGVKVPIDRREFKPSLTPLLDVTIEEQTGRGLQVGAEVRGETRPARWVFGKDRTPISQTSLTQSGAQSQLFAMRDPATGETFKAYDPKVWRAGQSQSMILGSTTEVRPSERWRRARETSGWRLIDDLTTGAGERSVRIGEGLQAVGERKKAAVRAGSTIVGARYFGNPELNIGKGFVVGGDVLRGVGATIREEPQIAAVSLGAAIATSGATTFLGTAASFGSRGALAWYAALTGGLAVAGGYYGASEFDAIRKAENPAFRSGQTLVAVGAWGVGSGVGSSLVPSPRLTGVRTTSTKGVTTVGNNPVGTLTRRGSASFSWFGKSRSVKFVASESYLGDGTFTGSVQYAGSRPVRYGGTMINYGEPSTGVSVFGGRLGQQSLIYDPRGVETSLFGKAPGGQGQSVYGRSVRPGGESGTFFGTLTGGRSNVRFVSSRAPTRGLFTFATGEAASVFSPASGYTGFLTTGGSGSLVSPGVGAGAGYVGVPSFGVFGSLPKPGARSLPLGISVGKPSSGVQVTSLSRSLVGLRVESVTMAAPDALGVSGARSDVIGDAIPDSLSTAESFTTGGSTGGGIIGGGSSWTPPPPAPPPPGFPGFIGPLPFGGGRQGRGGSRAAQARFKTSYNPSIAAEVFGIRGTRRQGLAAARTGISVRPIV